MPCMSSWPTTGALGMAAVCVTPYAFAMMTGSLKETSCFDHKPSSHVSPGHCAYVQYIKFGFHLNFYGLQNGGPGANVRIEGNDAIGNA